MKDFEISKLSKEELVNLKQEIDDRLKTIEVKTTKPKKGTILSLKKGDKILGIKLSFGGHRLAEPKELNGKVEIVDYCDILDMSFSDDSDDFSISISHPTKPFGIRTTLWKDDYKDEHCYLDIDTMKTGYDVFYTLKPESWKEDLIRMFDKNMEERDENYQKELDILKSKLDLIIDSEDKINQCI